MSISDTEERLIHKARFYFPGALFPEDLTRQIPEPTLESAVSNQPKDQPNWYAVEIRTITEKRYVAWDGDEIWEPIENEVVGKYVIGHRVHADDPSLAGEEFRILRSNLMSNSKDGYGVRTRCGNWQPADHYDEIIDPVDPRIAA